MRRTHSHVVATLAVALLTLACGGTDPSGAAETTAGAASITPAAKPPPSACKGQTTSCNGVCVNLKNDPSNCGTCGNSCSVPNTTQACVRSTCTFVSCNAAWGDCDASLANGCETDLQTSVTSCGACGNACTVANGTPSCTAGTCGVAACNSGYYLAGGACIRIGPPNATSSTLVASSASAVVGGSIGLTASIKDASGYPLAGVTVVFSGTTADSFNPPSAVTDANGQASSSVTTHLAGARTIVASVGGAPIASAAVSFDPGPAATLGFTVQPASATAGALLAPVQVAVLDSYGNLSMDLTLVSLAISGGATLRGTTSALPVNGLVEFSDLFVERAGTSYRLVASAAGLTGATSDAFDVMAGAPDVTASALAVAAASFTAGGQTTVTATVRDFYANPASGATVTFAASGSANSFQPGTGTSDAAGVTASTFSSTRAETKTLTAAIIAAGQITTSPTVTVTAGPASSATSTLVASPTSVASGGAAAALTVGVKDVYANPIPGAAVTFTSSGTATLLQPGPTDGAGSAVGSVSSSAPGIQTITARVGGIAVASTTVTFTEARPCGDYAESGILQNWTYAFDPGAGFTTTLSAPTAPSPYRGRSFLRAVTTAAFSFSLIYTAPTPIDARGFEQLRFAVRALNPNILVGGSPWQGAYPIVSLQDSSGASQRYVPTTNLMPWDGTTWAAVTVPIGGGSGWSVSGAVDLASITRITLTSDTWEWDQLTIDVDGVSFEHATTICMPETPVEIGAFYATPAKIVAGGTATLAWDVAGATALTIDNGVGSVGGSSTAVMPGRTTTYTLTASNSLGTATRSATVDVAPVLPSGLSVLDGIDLTVEAGAQATGDFVVSNVGAASHAAQLSVINPHPELTVNVIPTSPMVFPPGHVTTVPIQVSASASASGTYDDLLLSIEIDDGSRVNASIHVTVRAAGAADLPDLVVRASDIRLTGNEPGVSMTLAADVKNLGSLSASNVAVSFYLFGSLIGTDVVSMLPSQATATATITAPIAVTNGDEYVTVKVDPLDAIEEAEEGNNEASQIVRLGAPQTQVGILIIGSMPTKVCTGRTFGLSGHATYDLVVNGQPTTDYVVKGAPVDVSLQNPDGTTSVFGTTHTNVLGDFNKTLEASMPGTYRVFMSVTDKTFTGTRELVFTAEACSSETPPPPPPPPGPPPGSTGGSGGGPQPSWECFGDYCVYQCFDRCSVPPEHETSLAKNVWVYSEDIYFSNDHPAVGEEITVFANIRYWSNDTRVLGTNIPVSIYATSPGSPPVLIGHAVIDRLSVGSPDYGARMIFGAWKNPGEGVYIIEFAIDPSYVEAYTLDNAATRAIVIGQYTGTLGAIAGHAAGAWGGVAGAVVTVSTSGDTVIGSTVTDATGFYLIENVPPGSVQVGIRAPAPYVPLVESKNAVVETHALTTVDFTLSTIKITPTTATVVPGGQATFTASGGFGPYTWSISPNGSGGTISSTGQYTAGATGSATDTVVVTDVQGATARATVTVTAPPRWVQVAAGDNFSFGIKSDGSLWAWGENSYGQLGIGSTTSTREPVPVGTGYASVAAGKFHALALKTDGTLWAWGRNEACQVGDGTFTLRAAPVLIGAGYAQVTAGHYHSLAVTTDGTLTAWGANYSGQLGDGTTIDRCAPQPVGTGFASASGGMNHTLAVRIDGTLVSFGSNASGELGTGSTVEEHTPQVVGAGYRAAAASINGSCGLRIDGTVTCWGGNLSGQVGDGTRTTRLLPVPIGTGFQAIARTVGHTVALKTDGSLWAWGGNALGQLGDGTTTNSLVPKQITGAIAAAATGRGHTLAVKDDGTLLVWGFNSSGQFGDQTVLASLWPIPGGTPGTSILHSPSLAFVDQPGSVQVGDPLPALRVQLLDGYGNLVTTSTPDVQMTFRRVTDLHGTTIVTPINGEAVFADLYITAADESNLVASAPGYVTAFSRYFEVLPGAPSAAASTLTATPTSVPANGTPATLTAYVSDAYGNAVYGTTVTFSSSGNGSIVQPAVVTDGYGVTIGSISSTVIGAQQVTASVAGVPIASVLVSFTCPADGASCGTDMVCSAGECVSCVAGSECTPSAPVACHTYAWSCSSGPACVDTGIVEAGTSCGDGYACDGTGACASVPRSVAGVFQTTYSIDDGTQVVSTVTLPSPPATGTGLYALVAGAGGYTRYDGSFDATTGIFSIPGVPGGRYLLVTEPSSGTVSFREQEASSPDLTAYVNGRPDVEVPTGATNVLFDLGGLAPWQQGSDEIEMVSSNASLWFQAFGPYAFLQDLPEGATSVTSSVDVNALVSRYGFIGLPDATKGDVVFVHQLSKQVIPDGQPGAGTPYEVASRYARLTDVTIDNLSGGTIAAALQPTPTRTVSVDARFADFAALAPQLPPAATPSDCTVFVDAVPSGNWGRAGSADLLSMTVPLSTPNVHFGALAYGSFLDPIWKERANVRCYFQVAVTAAGASTPAQERLLFESEYLVDSVPPLAPALGPPLAPTINGADAFQIQTGVGYTPTLSWSVPSTGEPTSYGVTLRRLGLGADGTSTTLGARRYNFRLDSPPPGTTTMSLVIPPGVLTAGREYIAEITASMAPNSQPGTDYPNHYSSTATAKFSP